MNDEQYNKTLEFLFSQLPSYQRIGKAAYRDDLDNIVALDKFLGHPHRKFNSVHVAGTNGKGSVSHMTASVLQEAGYRTGLFTSPHLKDFRERIRVNGSMIPEDKVISFVEKNRGIIKNVKPSFFEMTVAMAFDYFAASEIDVAIIEVGLGGRLDSTNIITPVLSVITNIGHDHMNILGSSLEKIAYEKAGIIKPGVPVVISETQKEISGVFTSKARETGSPVVFADTEFRCVLSGPDQSGERQYNVTGSEGEFHHGITVLGGDYQSKNIQAVYMGLRMLEGKFIVSENNVSDGIRNVIKNTGLTGRWQITGHDPLVICDTGHNREGFEYIIKQLKAMPKKNLHMIIGFVNDKDLSSVLPLFPQNAVYYFTKASVPRALDENILLTEASEYGLKGASYPDVRSALSSARSKADPSDLIFVGGSTFIVADAL